MLGVTAWFVGLVVDVGFAFQEKQETQNAADAAALAAAGELLSSADPLLAEQEALAYAQANASDVTVNVPPLSGSHAGDGDFIEVIITSTQPVVFRGPLADAIWDVSSRAVAGIAGDPSTQLDYTFVSLREDCEKHSLKVDAGGTLTVNAGIYVNSCNVEKGDIPPGFRDAFDIFGAGGHIAATKVSVVSSSQPIAASPSATAPPRRTPDPQDADPGLVAALTFLVISEGSLVLEAGADYAAEEIYFDSGNDGDETHNLTVVSWDGDPAKLPVDSSGRVGTAGILVEDFGELGASDFAIYEVEPIAPGNYVIFCSIAGHYGDGEYAPFTIHAPSPGATS